MQRKARPSPVAKNIHRIPKQGEKAMTPVLTDYVTPWDVIIFFGVPVVLMIFVLIQEYSTNH